MEKKIKKILLLIDTKFDNIIKELQEKKSLLKLLLNSNSSYIKQFDSNNLNFEKWAKNEQKQLLKIDKFVNKIHNILIKDYKDDFIMNIKQIMDFFEILEDNEPISFGENNNSILNKKNNFEELRMTQKNIINDFNCSKPICLCSLNENNNIYNKLCVGLINGNIIVYDINSGNKLVGISVEMLYNEPIIDICDLKNGIIACTIGYYNISIIKIKEEILTDKDNISIKCSYEIIQKIISQNKERYAQNRIINIKLNNRISQNKLGDYLNDYLIQSGWTYLKVYIKKNNGRYYFYKDIIIPSRIYSLFNYDKYNLFFGLEYFSSSIFVFSSKTMELISVIKGLKGNGRNLNPFTELNNKLFVFLGLHSIYLYNINMKLIQELKFDNNFLGQNIIYSKNNSLLISLFNMINNKYEIVEYIYIQKEKKLEKKRKLNYEESILDFFENEVNLFLSNNKYGKKYLIILQGNNKIFLLK